MMTTATTVATVTTATLTRMGRITMVTVDDDDEDGGDDIKETVTTTTTTTRKTGKSVNTREMTDFMADDRCHDRFHCRRESQFDCAHVLMQNDRYSSRMKQLSKKAVVAGNGWFGLEFD